MSNEAERHDDHNGGLSDAELAGLERDVEQCEPTFAPEVISPLHQEHRSAYEIIDELAAPIRAAIESVDEPPQLADYEELTEIARGGMGVVYRGLHRKTRRLDAIKVMRQDRLAGMPSDMARLMRLQFLRESRLAARVAHEHIVPVYQVGESDGRPWFSMQLVDGSSLRELATSSTTSFEQVVRYIEQIARAIDAVHRHGILHGDIKPHNILIERETDRPLIGDFGLADIDAAMSQDIDAGIAGTPAYMAPELAVAASKRQAAEELAATRSVSSDIYSLGATLWAALSGSSLCHEDRTPKEQLADVAAGQLRSLTESDVDVPPALLRIIAKCLAKDPSARYSTAGEFADELAMWLDRPRWNRHFPRLRNLLWMVVAPVIMASGVAVSWLLDVGAAEIWIWLAIFAGYAPLFATFITSQRGSRAPQQASRELWSIWIGHLFASLACLLALRILCHPDIGSTLTFFYPCWAALSSLVFFAKSGNFWSGYRWVGAAWALVAVMMTFMPSPTVLFGAFAAVTCVVIARVDRSFLDE